MTYQFPPRLMQAKAAAHYLGVSASKLRTLGIPVRVSGANRLYDIHDLNAYADQLSYADSAADDTRQVDEVWRAAHSRLNT